MLKDSKKFLFKAVVISLSFVIFHSLTPEHGYAEKPISGIDFMFVIDESASMKSADKQQNVQQALELFVDLSVGTENRLGYVLYNDEVVAAEPLAKIVTEKEKEMFLNQADTAQRGGNTDLGLGLAQAQSMLKESKSENKQVVILLNDGETFASSSEIGRTIEQSNQDIDAAVAYFQSALIPVYSISLNEGQISSNQTLESITSNTGGDAYTAYSAGELSGICFEIYGEFMKMPVQLIETVTTTNELQNFDIEVPNDSLSHFKIAIATNQPLEEVQLSGPSDEVTIEKSQNYAVIDMENPLAGVCHLQIRGSNNDIVKIVTLGDYPFEARIDPLPGNLVNGSTVPINVYLWDLAKEEKVTDPALFKSLIGDLLVHDSLTNTDEHYTMDQQKNYFSYDYPVNGAGELVFTAHISGANQESRSSFATATVGSVASSVETIKPIQLKQGMNSNEYNLDELFLKEGKKPQSYQIVSNEPTNEILIQDHQLVTEISKNNEVTVTVQATFSENDISQAEVTVAKVPFWLYYWPFELATMVIIVLLISWYFVTSGKRRFHGRLEGYFLQTASSDEFPVQIWPSTHFKKRRKTTLQQLFDVTGVTVHLPESRQIYLMIAENNCLTFMHKTNCFVQLKKEVISSYTSVLIGNNDRLYITFEDGVTEIELRVRKKTT